MFVAGAANNKKNRRVCTIALLFSLAATASQGESHHSSGRDFIALSLFISGEDGGTH